MRYAIPLETEAPAELGVDDHAALLARYADAAGVTFTNIALVPPSSPLYRGPFFGAEVYVAFDATEDDVARYCAHFDADRDIVVTAPRYMGVQLVFDLEGRSGDELFGALEALACRGHGGTGSTNDCPIALLATTVHEDVDTVIKWTTGE